MKINRIVNIPIRFPVDAVLSRLGRYRHFTEISIEQKRRLDAVFQEGFALCQLTGVWGQLPILEHRAEETLLGEAICLPGSGPAKLLANSSEILFFGATAGNRIYETIQAASSAGEGFRALCLDAVGSECTDAAMDFMQRLISDNLRRLGKKVTQRRFSPGYGDLPLEFQKILVPLLQMETIGVTLSPSCFMSPEKTVPAFAGIEYN